MAAGVTLRVTWRSIWMFAGATAERASETLALQHDAREIVVALVRAEFAEGAQRGHSFLSCASPAIVRAHAQADDIGPGSDTSVTASANQPSPLRSQAFNKEFLPQVRQQPATP